MTSLLALRSVSAKPIEVLPYPKEDRNIYDRLAGRSVCIVIDDKDFFRLRDTVKMLVGDLTVARWSDFLHSIHSMKTDFVLILSPRDLKAGIRDLESGLRVFKKRNPDSVIVMNNLHSPISPQTAQLTGLQGAGLIDHLEQGFTFFPLMLQHGAEMLEAKV